MDLQEMRRSSASSSISAPEPDVPLPDEKKEEAEPSVASLSNAPKAEASNFDAEEKGEPAARTRTHSVNNISSIPNGGLRAWLQVLGSFFLFFNTWGVVNNFGTYQTFYERDLLSNSSPSAISWIGSIQGFLLLLVGALTGPVYDAGYFRELLLTGTVLVVVGQMMLSLCKEYWQVLLAQAFCIGLGTGCLFVPGVAILSTYFTTKIATVTGIAAAGSSLGGVLFPIIFHKLEPHVGFGWATRISGFIMLGTLLVPNLVMKVRVLPATRRAMLDLPAFKEPAYSLFCFSNFLIFIGMYVPFFYVQLYSLSHGTSANLAFYLISIINAASTFGRIVPNAVADKLGPFNIAVPCTVLSGMLIFVLISIDSSASTVLFCVFYGFFSGALVSLPPTMILALSPSRGVIGTRLGMCFAFTAIGILIGTPIAGAILNAHGFTATWVFGGVMTTGGGLCLMGARNLKVGWKFVRA